MSFAKDVDGSDGNAPLLFLFGLIVLVLFRLVVALWRVVMLAFIVLLMAATTAAAASTSMMIMTIRVLQTELDKAGAFADKDAIHSRARERGFLCRIRDATNQKSKKR